MKRSERATVRRERPSAYAAAARSVATVRLGLPFPTPATARGAKSSPSIKPAPASQRARLEARLVVLLAGFCALTRVGVSEPRARMRTKPELGRALKLAGRLGLTEASALALAQNFVRKNWKAIELVAGAVGLHAAQRAELKRWQNREVRILIEIADGRSDWSAIVPHEEWAAGEVAGFIEMQRRA